MNPSAIYRRLAELPVFTSLSFLSKSHLSIESSVRDHVNNTKRTFIQQASLPNLSSGNNSARDVWLSYPVERAESIVARLISPSGRRTAILKETNATPKKRFVEIWKEDRAELILETTSRHGPFYGDATFSSLCFSPDETAILYTAEANAPKESSTDPFQKFRFEASYGETFIERRRPTLFWLRWDESTSNCSSPSTRLLQINPSVPSLTNDTPCSHALEDPPNYSLGQATFASQSGTSVLATDYLRSAGDRKLGIVYCTNRPSTIVHFDLPHSPLPPSHKKDEQNEKEEKEEEEASVKCRHIFTSQPSRSPRVWFPPQESNSSEQGSPVAIWVSNAKEPHGSASRLHFMSLSNLDEVAGSDGGKDTDGRTSTSHIKTVVDTIWEPRCSVREGGFPGLYINQLPPNPFILLNNSLYAVCISSWGSRQEVVRIKLPDQSFQSIPPSDGSTKKPSSDQVCRLSLPESYTSATGLTTDDESILVVAATGLTRANEVFVARLSNEDSTEIEWCQVTSIGDRVKDLLEQLEWEEIDIPDRAPVQTLLLRSKDSSDQPLITMPHGGPHAVTSATFSAEACAFALSGYMLSFPNYTGSLGYGQRWVEELLGKVGRLEIDDVMASIKELVRKGIAKETPEMQLYMGGSHGGFIGAHVIGQFPSFFAAAVLRNPVINIGSMVSTTDIPDWTTVECGVPYNPSSILKPELYSTLYSMSPVQYADQVKTPVLLRIGDVDQRVPPSQGKEYYHLLKARGLGEKVQMLWFPENGHPLDKVEAERTGWEATLAWFQKFGRS